MNAKDIGGAELPKSVWIEVDVRNKELPVKIADSAEELAMMCGVKTDTVRVAAYKGKYGRTRQKYRKVWIGEDV